MSRRLSGFLAAALIAFSGTAMVVASFEAEAKRAGSGSSVGRQSTNVTSQRQATTPPAAASTTTAKSSAAAPAAGAATAGAAAKSGASRWLGPLAGIAAGLGIAALLSHLGLSGAFADFLVLALIAAAVVFGVMFFLRRMRGGQAQPAMQGAGAEGSGNAYGQPGGMMRESLQPTPEMPAAPSAAAGPSASFGADATQDDLSWFIPQDFDTHRFLQEAKQQFVAIQKIWDSGDVAQLRNFMTDDLMKELEAQLKGRTGTNRTDVVLLNAELLGIEKVSDGHLASVRFSGMLREDAEAEAFRFEEVWNLFKPEQGGWLLAGIQQVPVSQAS
jgi:predicted lipid-binding transport protein (Tim44 family)